MLLVCGQEDVAGDLDILYHQRLDDLVDRLALAGECRDVGVVIRRTGDRLLEDGRIGRHPAKAFVLVQRGERTGGQQVAGDEVVPRALAQCAESGERVTAHWKTLSFRRVRGLLR